MIPEARLSTTNIVAGYTDTFYQGNSSIDVEMGGVALNDASLGLLVKPWTLRYDRQSGDMLLSAPGVTEFVVFNRPDITEVSLAFNRNMEVAVAFVQAGQAKLYWYDNTLPGHVFEESLLGAAVNPRICHDDKRQLQDAVGEIILGYVRAGNLYFRAQRDRFLVEYLLKTGGMTRLYHVGINRALRLQFMTNGSSGVNPPLLADVVRFLASHADVGAEKVNVDELYDDVVHGIKVQVDEGVDKPIDWLRDIFWFDKSEHDRKIHFPKRGRAVIARIPYTDLVQGNPVALKQKRADEKKLPKLVNINHIDPDGGYAKNKQTAQRRSNMVHAKGKNTIESQIVLTADQAATSALQKLKVFWNELIDYSFATTKKWTELTTGDVVEVEDSIGTWHRMRLEERNEDGNILEWEGKQDAGQRTYGVQYTGNALPPPTSTTPGLVGETNIEILNIGVQRDQHDELGLYIGASGTSSAWTGYWMYISTDGGVTYNFAYEQTIPATVGETLTDLLEEVSYEYQSEQTVDVTTNFALSSVTFDQILANQNRCVIGDEVLQYQTATFLGMVGTLFSYRLSGLVRARYASQPLHWPSGTRFVFLDEAIVFAQAQQWMLGMDVYYKPVTIGHTQDETIATSYLFDEGISQTEWPVAHVTAVRDVSDNVTVGWVGAARLGVDTAPYHSKYMVGYRVKYSDGHTTDVVKEVQTAVRASTPVGATVQVCALNSITGEGPYSDPLST